MTSTTSPASGPLLIHNVRLGCGGPAASVLIADGRIAALGPDLSAEDAREVVDAAGRTVLPGFWDAHVHILQWASARRRLDLSGAPTARAAAELMADAAREGRAGPGEPLIGFGFRDALWPDRPEPALLDWAGEGQVVALVSQDLHAVWLSRGALRAIGRAGHPTGLLREHDCLDAVARLAQTDTDTADRWVEDALRAAAARGVVGILDFEFADNVTHWRRRAERGPLDVRIRSAIYPEYLDEAVAAGLHTGDPLPGTGGQVKVGPLKLFVDGSLNTRTALCNDPYPATSSEQERFGILQTAPDDLVRLMTRAAANGIEPAVHAIGDRANTIALDAFDQVGCPGRIEHAQLIDLGDLRRFARPGLVLGIQPAHATDDRDIADHHWAGRTHRAYAYAELARAGATLEIGSDAPVSPLDPWEGIAAAVHRTDDDREPWHPEQAITLDDALAAAARGRRVLRAGDPADLVIVDHDPSVLAPHELREMPVYGTLLGGRWTHRT